MRNCWGESHLVRSSFCSTFSSILILSDVLHFFQYAGGEIESHCVSICFPCLLVGLVILPHTHTALSLPYIHIWSLRFPFQLISGWLPACFSVQLSTFLFFFFNCVWGGLSLFFGGGVLKFWIWILYWWYAFNILSQPMTCLFT